MIVDAPGPAGLVVDRHPGMRAERMAGARRDDGVPGHDPGRDAPVIFAGLGVAPRADQQAAGEFLDLEQRHAVLLVVDVALRALEQRILVELRAVQPGDVAGIDAAFHRLQVIALLQTLRHETLLGHNVGPFQRRRRRLQRGRPHIGPDDAGLLDAGVGFQLDVLAEAGVLRLRRQVDALAGDVVFPAVVVAADAAVGAFAEPQRDAAMRAELVDQADAALGVAEGDQLFAHQLDLDRRTVRLGQLVGEQERRPIAAQQFAHQRAGADAAELLVLFTRHHGDVSLTVCYSSQSL